MADDGRSVRPRLEDPAAMQRLREAQAEATARWVQAAFEERRMGGDQEDGGGALTAEERQRLRHEAERTREGVAALTERRKAALLHYAPKDVAEPDRLLECARAWAAGIRTAQPQGLPAALGALAAAHPVFAEQYRAAYMLSAAAHAPSQQAWEAAGAGGDPQEAAAQLRAWFWADNPEDETHEVNIYHLVRQRHEREYFKIRSPGGYGFMDLRRGLHADVDIMSRAGLVDACCEITFWDHNAQTKAWEEHNFIQEWLKDKDKRCVRCFVSRPLQDHAHDEFNLWSRPEAESLPPVAPELVADMVAPILHHIREVLSAGDEVVYQYVLSWMAALFRMPQLRTGTILLFYGEQGVGKDIIWDFIMRKVLGRRLAFQTANVQRDLFGQFSAGLANRKLIICDEVGNLRSMDSVIKNIVTAPTINFEKKNVNPITIDNFACLIATTNNLESIFIAPSDRRVVAVDCSKRYKGNADYFEALLRLLDAPDTPRALYQHFMEGVDLSEYAWEGAFQQRRPITDFYIHLQQTCLSLEDRFLSAIVNQYQGPAGAAAAAEGDGEVAADEPEPALVVERDAKQVHLRYKEMGEYESRDGILNQSNFGRDIRKRGAAVLVVKTCRGKNYRFDIAALHDDLVRARRFDPEAHLQVPL